MNYRLMNQDFYRRNLIPCMLGWFKFDANTSIEYIEWLLARSAAFDAGYTLVTNKDNVSANGESESIIKAIREWETARLSGAFPKELKKEMEYIANEYILNQISENSWDLFPYAIERYKHQNVERQPGEPVLSKWTFSNQYQRQPVQFILKANDRVSDISMEIANFSTIKLPVTLDTGEFLKYTGGTEAGIYDKNWNLKRSILVDPQQMTIPNGESQIIFSCTFSAQNDPEKVVSGEFKTIGEVIKLNAIRQINN